MLSSRYYSASRLGTDAKPRTAMVLDVGDEEYTGFDDVAPALDTRALREDQAFQEAVRTAGRKAPSRMGTGMFRQATSVRLGSSRGAGARPMTAVRAAGFTSAVRTPSADERREESVEDKVKQMEARIMALVEESCLLSHRPRPGDGAAATEYDLGKALAKAQEASSLERQLIRTQEQAGLGDSHNMDLTFAVLCNLAGHYTLNEMYTEALNTYQLLTRNRLFPHANRLKVNMGNIYFKMGEHPKALKLYRMALDQTPTAEKDLRMKVMHNIGLLLVRMGKFRDAVANFQHIMHEQGDFQTGLHLVLCSVALDDAEGGRAAFHAMLDVEPPTHHHDIPVDDESDSAETVLRDVCRSDRLARWARAAAARAERCLALAAAAAARADAQPDASMSWCVEALRGCAAGGGGAGARLEASAALAGLRAPPLAAAAGARALQRLRAVARAHRGDRAVCAEANADAAFVAYALGNYSEALSLSQAAARTDPYASAARVTQALAAVRAARGDRDGGGDGDEGGDRDGDDGGDGDGTLAAAVEGLTQATQLDPADLIAAHDLSLALESGGDATQRAAAAARWARLAQHGAGATLRAAAAAGLARLADDAAAADHWYSSIGTWDAGVARALARLHAAAGDSHAARQHYQDVEAAWPCSLEALEWLAEDARADPPAALQYYRRAARLQPSNPQWPLLLGGCLRAAGRYQDALALYKRMHERFPDNVPCLKLIVKLCGSQGLRETREWSRELARAREARGPVIPTVGSASSTTSRSPVEPVRASRADSSRGASARSRLSAASSLQSNESFNQERRPAARAPARDAQDAHNAPERRADDFDDDLPLPPE